MLHEPIFHPATVRAPWPVPRIDTVGELAERFELDPGQLAWLADVRGPGADGEPEAAQLHVRARAARDTARRA